MVDPVVQLLHAGQPEAKAESAAGQLTRELALPVELAIVAQRGCEKLTRSISIRQIQKLRTYVYVL